MKVNFVTGKTDVLELQKPPRGTMMHSEEIETIVIERLEEEEDADEEKEEDEEDDVWDRKTKRIGEFDSRGSGKNRNNALEIARLYAREATRARLRREMQRQGR